MFVMYTFRGVVQFWEYGQGSAFYEHNQMNNGQGLVCCLIWFSCFFFWLVEFFPLLAK